MTFVDQLGGSARALREGDTIHLEGSLHRVVASDESRTTFTIEPPFGAQFEVADAPPLPPSLAKSGSGEVWIMLEQRAPCVNLDVQVRGLFRIQGPVGVHAAPAHNIPPRL